MSRRTISRLFYGSLIAIGAALLLALGATAMAFQTGSLVVEGPNQVRVTSALGWVLVTLGAIAIFTLFVAAIAQVVAWIGALIATAPEENKTWFLVLLVGGLLGFTFLTMLLYLLIDTDERTHSGHRPAIA
jgi:ABC-type antimicrobial peptide transport system permease subunit